MSEEKTIITNPIVKNKVKPTRKNAINAMCANCMGCTEEKAEAGFRNLIRECKSVDCPLHEWRPYKTEQES